MDNAVLQRLDAMDARAKAATPGARAYADEGGWYSLCADVGSGPHQCVARFPYKNENWEADVQFHGAAREDLPAATKLLRALLARDATMHMRGCICVTCDDATRALAEFAKGDA